MKHQVETPSIFKVSRRNFIKTTGIGFSGLMFGMHVGCSSDKKGGPTASFSPNVYLNIDSNGDVTIIAHRSEMGQGVRTALPMIVADELGADWNRVKIKQAEGNEEKYGNQNTDGSFSVRMFYVPLRKAGAMARMMMENAAAKEWGVDVKECKVNNHNVVSSSGDKLSFGDLAAAAAELPVPSDEEIKLKDKKDFKYIGKGTPIVDGKAIVNGTAGFGLDKKLPNMKVAVIARCPVAGGKIKSFDDTEALKIDGVNKILTLESPGFPTGFQNPLGGVVVVAENTWAALKGRDALKIDWEEGINADYDTSAYMNKMTERSDTKGSVRREDGTIEKAMKTASRIIEATYKLPHYSHAPMEPPCAVAQFKNGKCEIWAPTQHPQWAVDAVAEALGVEKKNVIVNVTLLGGGFGRKSKPDFVVESALIAQKCDFPVKLMWTREDDIHHDFLHAISVQRVRVAIGRDNKILGWHHNSVFPPIGGTATKDAVEPDVGEVGLGFIDFPYAIPNICLETNEAPTKIRVGWLRSVANIQHAFSICSMIDELAVARGKDPVENMVELLGEDRNIAFEKMLEKFPNYNEPIQQYPWNTGRLKNVINLVAEKSKLGKELPDGRGQGIAAHRSFLTYVACVVEVEVKDGKITIPEVHYAVDCGVVVHPERVINQFEGGAVFASSLALKSRITVKNGKVEQDNFDKYHLARMSDAPKNIYVHLVESEEKPTGVGEPPVPPFNPALCNAIYAATGKRIRELPINMESLT